MLVAYLAGNRRAIRREVVDGRVNSGDKRLSEANLDLDLADHLRHPSITCSRPMTVAPSRISSDTLRPSRAPSST